VFLGRNPQGPENIPFPPHEGSKILRPLKMRESLLFMTLLVKLRLEKALQGSGGDEKGVRPKLGAPNNI
jgi:hypothetical protein